MSKLPNNFRHPVCIQCLKKQKEKYGKVTIRCNGYRDADLILGDIEDTLTPEQLNNLKELYDPVIWAYNNIETKPGQPWVPRASNDGEPYQTNLLKCSAFREVFRLGRRTGKSESLAVLILWMSLTNNNYSILVVAPFQSQLDEIFERVVTYAETSPKIKSKFKKFTKTPHIKVEFKNGSVVKALPVGKKGDTVRSKSANVIIVDEADYVDDSVWNAFLPILMDYPDTRLVLASTPTGRKSKFYQFCHDPKVKEWHYPTTVLPHWGPQMEAEMRAELTQLGYIHEVEAEFGESEIIAVRNEYIDKSQYDYIYEDMQPRDSCVYSIGVDWNSYKNGTRIIVTELDLNERKYKIVDKAVISSKEWTQTLAIEKIFEFVEKWNAKYLYIDEGYGAASIEVIKKTAITSNPESALYQLAVNDHIKPINFSSTIEVKDPLTNKKLLKPAKNFLVENMVRYFEKGILAISKYDEELIKQLENYGVVGYRKDNGIPIYGAIDREIGDHDIDALMLSLLPFTLDSGLFKTSHLSGGIISKNILPTKARLDNIEEDEDDLYIDDEIIDYSEEPYRVNDVENQSFVNMPITEYMIRKQRIHASNGYVTVRPANALSRSALSRSRRPGKRTWRD